MVDQEKLQKLEELKKQREQLDKLIEEYSIKEDYKTNIAYTQIFIDRYLVKLENIIINKSPNELLEIKLFINKKCNQISTDYNHTNSIITEFMKLKDDNSFIEIFSRKLIEKGRIQVSSHFDSYKPFSYIIYSINSEKLIENYISLMIIRKGTDRELSGMYAIYFGVLRLREDIQGCWFWMGSVLNCKPSEFSGNVFETFLIICGEMLKKNCGNKFEKILKYIKQYYLKELNNKPVEIRILNLIEGYNR